MSKWGSPAPRTAAEKARACQDFCVKAERKVFDATTPDDLVRRYGVDEATARQWHAYRSGVAW